MYKSSHFPKQKKAVAEKYRKRYQEDTHFRLRANLRNRLRGAIKNKQKIGSAVDELGAPIAHVISYLEALFVPGMSWANHGTVWDIDHIMPLNSFNLENIDDFRKACNYTNLRPLFKKENAAKGDRLPESVIIKNFMTGIKKVLGEGGEGQTISCGGKELELKIIGLQEPAGTTERQNDQTKVFFASELRYNEHIVRSMILNFFGQSIKFDARDAQIVRVLKGESSEFFSNNHLMGASPSATAFGLAIDGQLVAVMTTKYHKDRSCVEISRFASRCGTSVRGGFSRLLSHAISYYKQTKRVPKSIISFCDLRYSSGNSYTKSGFIQVGLTQGWMWTDGWRTYNRLKCRANMDARGLTENEHAKEFGWVRIFDCGQAKYEKALND